MLTEDQAVDGDEPMTLVSQRCSAGRLGNSRVRRAMVEDVAVVGILQLAGEEVGRSNHIVTGHSDVLVGIKVQVYT